MSAVISPTWPWSPNLAPEWLKQSFNNGWTFGNIIQVTNQNSSAPEVEREVVSEHSYGQQIGRLMDAVVALSGRVPGATEDKRVSDLLDLARDIDAIKEAARKRRLTELLEELKSLKQHDKTQWEQLMKAVRD